MPDIAFDRFHRYTELTALLHDLVRDPGDLLDQF